MLIVKNLIKAISTWLLYHILVNPVYKYTDVVGDNSSAIG